MLEKILLKLNKRFSVYVTCAILVAAFSAPLFSYSSYTNDIKTNELSVADEVPMGRDSESTSQDITNDTYDSEDEFFNPDGFQIAEYTREEFDIINRSALAQSEDLLFGTMDEEFQDQQIPVPPDMTFEEDNTNMYIIANSLSFRELPSVDANIMKTYYWSDKLLVTGIGDGWYRVKDSEGDTGYVMSGYFSDTKPTPSPTPTPTPTKAPVRANTIGESVALEAQKYLGIRYVWGGKNPDYGFDCSGFTSYVYNRYGISTPVSSYSYGSNVGTIIPYSMIAPGDVITWNNGWGNSLDHVSIYIGDGKMIHATNWYGVKIHSVSYYQSLGYRLMTVHRFYKE